MPAPRCDHISADPAGAAGQGPCIRDPWDGAAPDAEYRDNWLLSYIDILTLLLSLFVLLLVLQPKAEGPWVQAAPKTVPAPDPPSVTALQTAARVSADGLQYGQETVSETAGDSVGTPAPAPKPQAARQATPDRRAPETPPAPLTRAPRATEAAVKNDSTLQPSQQAAPHSTAAAEAPPPASPQDTPPSDMVDAIMARLDAEGLGERLRMSRISEGVHLEVRDNILFTPASVRLKPAGRQLLDELAGVFREQAGVISVEGHTDNRPIANERFPSNWELSSARATAVARYLIGSGLNPARLRAVGYADTRPVADNTTVEGRKRNRRVALIVHFP